MNIKEIRKGYVDRELKQIDVLEWGKLFEDFSYRLIAKTPIPSKRSVVNTIWLGVNDHFRKPFETIIFKDDVRGDPVRHATEQEAMDFHLQMVNALIYDGFLKYLQDEGLCPQCPVATAD